MVFDDALNMLISADLLMRFPGAPDDCTAKRPMAALLVELLPVTGTLFASLHRLPRNTARRSHSCALESFTGVALFSHATHNGRLSFN